MAIKIFEKFFTSKAETPVLYVGSLTEISNNGDTNYILYIGGTQ